MIGIKERIELAKEELKRVDHLFYVSLKYTRTVDVIKSVIERLIKAFDFSIDALLLYMQKKKKIKEIPSNPMAKCDAIKKLFSENKEFVNDVDCYILLRKVNRAEYSKEREFRRHVTMVAVVDDEVLNIDIDTIQEYNERTKTFVENAYNLIYGIKDE